MEIIIKCVNFFIRKGMREVCNLVVNLEFIDKNLII